MEFQLTILTAEHKLQRFIIKDIRFAIGVLRQHPLKIELSYYDNGWHKLATGGRTEFCKCGIKFDSPENNNFMFKEMFAYLDQGMKQTLKDIVESPTECARCYYYKEWKAGRFCPAVLKKQFEQA